MKSYLIYKLANLLYKYYYPLYKPLYFFYKKISDKEKVLFFEKEIKSGMTILDIGANIGFYSILFSNLTGGKCIVHCFEPDQLNFKYLTVNTKKLRNVYLNNCAVGEKSEIIRLYHSNELNVDHQTYDSGEKRIFTEVKCLAIDKYFKNNETVDIIKIDIQGYDYFALSGMKETIKRSDKVIILGELWPYGLNKAGVNVEEYIMLLEALGFKLNFFSSETDYKEKVSDKFFYTDFYGIKTNL